MTKSNAMVRIILFCCVAVFCGCGNKEKLGWVNISKVYGEFSFKKELETKLMQTQSARKKILDSLEFELNVLSRTIQSEQGKDKNSISIFETKRDQYLEKKNQFETDDQQLEKNYNEQILNQLNQYLKDYGKDKEFRYIFGAGGNGSLMYAQEADDITTSVIQYVNEKYKGK